jgi:hypothetical protein
MIKLNRKEQNINSSTEETETVTITVTEYEQLLRIKKGLKKVFNYTEEELAGGNTLAK